MARNSLHPQPDRKKGAVRIRPDSRVALEVEPRAHQHIAWRQVAVGGSEICARVSKIGVHSIEIYAVEQVEDIEAELQVQPLSDGCGLLHGEVRVGIARITELIRLFIAFRAAR